MARIKWLRQLGTGRLLPWTAALAARKDMVPMDPEKAKRRIEANKAILAEAKAELTPENKAASAAEVKEMAKIAAELTDTENQIDALHEQAAMEEPPKQKKPETDADIEENAREKKIAEDSHIAAIKQMTSGAELAKYIRREFGEDVDARSQSIDELRDRAIELRTERIFEGE